VHTDAAAHLQISGPAKYRRVRVRGHVALCSKSDFSIDQSDLVILILEFTMSASQPSRFAPSPSQSRPRNDFAFEPLLDSDEAALLLRIHPKTLQRMARNHEIQGIQVGKLWRFRTSDLERWLNAKRAG
jgi:excisionase family DNA binding protein